MHSINKVLGRKLFANNYKQFSAATFRATDLTIDQAEIRKIKPFTLNKVPFGTMFTDHMLMCDWTKEDGWAAPQIVPYGPIKIETSATSLHYGISVHEGCNVVENQKTGKLQGFRIKDHIKGLNDSSEHLDMPTFEADELIGCLSKLVNLDKDWIHIDSKEPDQFYTRFCHFSTDKTLGVRTAQSTKLLAFLNPVKIKHSPISLKCSVGVNKNWPLGHGSYRVSGNLGPLIPTVADARNNGFDDVLWLLDDYITEMTVMNVFTLWQSRYGHYELITPPDDGTILNGITRQTIVDLADEI